MSAEPVQRDSSIVGLAIAQWFDAVDRGGAPDREEFIGRYPAIAGELRQFFADYDSFRDHADVSPTVPPSAPVEAPLDRQPTITGPDTVAASARYRELQFFKKGGLGTLFRAFDEALHRETIVKFLSDKCTGNPALLTQFRVEAEITARLDHPGVVPVYGIGEAWNGRPFYIMRLVKGRELTQAIQEYHSLAAADPDGAGTRQQLFALLEHLIQACNTVAYAHDVGIIHCDLKPPNIMIGRYGETFVLDWGLAASFERTTTFVSVEPTMRPRSASGSSASGQRGGTYGYISPEQLSPDEPIGPASDIYSLGATLYEIVTGRSPFNGRDKDVIEQIRSGRYARPREAKHDISRRLEAICCKAMSLRPLDRYATAKHLAADLANWMRDDPIQAAPDRWTDRVGRFSRRHRALTAVAVVATLAVVAAAAWSDRATKLATHEQELRALSDENLKLESEARRAEAEKSQLVKTSFATALDTFEDLCRPLANGEMNNLGLFRPFADRINTFTKVYFDNLDQTRTPSLQTGRVYELRATVSQALSPDTTQALELYRQAEATYRAAAGGESDHHELNHRLSRIHLSQGQLHIQRSEYGLAEENLGRARESLEARNSKHPEDSSLKRDLAEVYHALGEVFLNRDAESAARHAALLESQTWFEKSKDLREQLRDSTKGAERRNYQRDLARSLGYLGDLYLAQGNVAKATEAYNRSKDLREELHRTNPSDPEHRFQYARGLGNFSYLERDYRGNLASAISMLKEAQVLQVRLADDFPEVAKFRRDLAGTLLALAELYWLEAAKNPAKLSEYAKLARETAARAETHYGSFFRASENHSDTDSVHSLAICSVIRAGAGLLEHGQLEFGDQSAKLARDAEDLLLKHIGREPLMSRSQLVVLALSRSLQGQPEPALRALTEAISRGKNTVQRFETHRAAGLRAIAEHPDYGPRLDQLCKDLRATLDFD